MAQNLGGCIKDGKPPELLLTGNVVKDAEAIKKIYYRIEQIVNNRFDQIRIGWLDENENIRVTALSWRKQNDKDLGHLTLIDEETGEETALRFGWKKLSPSVKFTDEQENILFDHKGQEMEYALLDFNKKGAPGKIKDATDWLILGIKAVALGFAIWLGAKIVGLVAGAIAFVAFNAMIIGLVLAGAVVLGAIVKWVLDKTGWDYDTARDFFGKAADEIQALFEEVAV
ncbi:MAG: hypothetical protein PHE77_03340 [Candidatus Pacebacteria bacterium]|nr:hypothetical protein [Candidatus Paceibacterota bacterium]